MIILDNPVVVAFVSPLSSNCSPLLQLLYDFEYEADKTCLVQSALLMGFWFGNTHDRVDSWHWIGVAITLGQALGFHRDPGRSNIPLSTRRLWRRIWSCCVYRDRYVALGMGRPCRIVAEDCDVPDVSLDDLKTEASSSDLSADAAATVQQCERLSPIFLELLRATKIMGHALACLYRPSQPPPTAADFHALDSELQNWYANMAPMCRTEAISLSADLESRVAKVHKYFIHITYQ